MEKHRQLLDKAIEAKENSYSPYSKFRVGAALLLKDNKIVCGANIENASYGMSMCAERVCLANAFSLGYKKSDILALAISADTKDYISPCGACRQVISELMNESCSVFLLNNMGQYKEIKVCELLPFAFKEDVLL